MTICITHSPLRYISSIARMSFLISISTLIACGGGGSSSTTPITQPVSDTSPNSFSFIDLDEGGLDVDTTSNQLTISGINAATAISIANGEYAIDGGDFTADAGTITSGQRVQVRVRTAAENNILAETTLTVGDASDTFSVTTEPQRRFEAEAGASLVDAMTMNEGAASSGQIMGNLAAVGSGVQFTDVPSAVELTLTYSSTSDTTLSFMVDGSDAGRFDIVSTGDLMTFVDASLDVIIPKGADITVTNTVGDVNVYLDVLTLTAPPLQEVTTLANSGIIPPAGGFGADGLSVAENGDVFVSGGPLTNNIVRVTSDGVVSEFATGFESANGSDFDSAGNLFVADYRSNSIKRVTSDGVVSVFVSDLDGPAGIYVDDNDNVIAGIFGGNFSGMGGTVLRIAPDGTSEVIAEGGGLRDVIGVVADENGDIYAGNFRGRQLYRITDENITLLATVSVNINQIDYSRGYIYIANNGRIVRVNTSTGEEELFSGTMLSQTVNGPVKSSDFSMPTSLAFSPDENILYVADTATGDIRKIAPRE